MALSLAKNINSISTEGVTDASFASDPRVSSFLFSAIPGEICSGVKTNNIPEGFSTARPISSMKRHSVSSIGGPQKKRKSSKTPLVPTFKEHVEYSGSAPMLDHQDLRFQQISQRRHSFQSLTSYQDSWLSQQEQQQQLKMSLNPYQKQQNVLSMNYVPPYHLQEHFPAMPPKEYLNFYPRSLSLENLIGNQDDKGLGLNYRQAFQPPDPVDGMQERMNLNPAAYENSENSWQLK